MKLFNAVTDWLYQLQREQELDESYVEKYVNKLTTFELLQAISEALEEVKKSQED